MIYVDNARIEKNNRFYSHLVSENLENLHIFASKLGLKRDWFHKDHYDVVETKRKQAINLGAIPLDLSNSEDVKILVSIRRKLRNSKLKWHL